MKRSLSAIVVSALLLAATVVPASAKLPGPGGVNPGATQLRAKGRAKMLLKLGELKTAPAHRRLGTALSVASKQALSGLPGVRMLEDTEDADAAANRRRPPVVMITGELTEVRINSKGSDIEASARVEYFVHRMPGKSIAAVVVGSARTKVPGVQVRKRPLRDQFEVDLVTAAVASAAKRTEPALQAALE